MSKKNEQGSPTVSLAPADAGAPPTHHFPNENPSDAPGNTDHGTLLNDAGWTSQAHAATLEARLSRHTAAGAAPAQAYAEADDHVTKAIGHGLQMPELVTHNHLHGHAVGHASNGVVHKHAHSHVKGAPHPHPASHYHIHTSKPAVNKEQLQESFSWTMPIKSRLQGGKRIKGAAITVGKTRNKVPYTQDELLRSARTLAKKPIYINHLEAIDVSDPDDPRYPGAKQYLAEKGKQLSALVRKAIESIIQRNDPAVGYVKDSEFEDDDQAVNYVGEVTDPATQAALPEAKGVSIGAIPRNPGEDKPVGIMLEDLSLIFPPETPGDPDATVKMMEKLMEMVRQPEEIHGRADAHLKMSAPVAPVNCPNCGAGNIWGLYDDKTKQCLACDAVTLLNVLQEQCERVLREQLCRIEQQERGWTPAARAAAAAARRAKSGAGGVAPAPAAPATKAPKVPKAPKVKAPKTPKVPKAKKPKAPKAPKKKKAYLAEDFEDEPKPHCTECNHEFQVQGEPLYEYHTVKPDGTPIREFLCEPCQLTKS